MTPFYKLFNGCGCAKCEADDAQSADTKIVNDYDTKIVNDYEGDDDEEVENTGYRSAMSAMRNSRLATLSESVFGTEDDPNSLEGLAEVGKKIKEKKIHQGPGAVASFLNVEGEDEELENRGVAALFNSQPCGDSHIPDGYQCHSGQAHELSEFNRKHLSVRTWNPETRKSDWQYWSSGAKNWLSAPTDEHGVPTPEFIRQALKLPLLSSEIKSERHRAMDDGEPYTQGYRVDTYAKGTRVPAGLQSHESREDNDGVKIMYPRTIKKLANSSVTALFNSQPCGDSHIPDSHQCHAGQGAATHEESSKPIGHIKDALIIGDGAKYVEFNGQLVPFVSRSATDRMRSGERYTVVISESYHPKYGKTLSADRPVGRLANSQPCGDSHIPDGAQCHVGQGAAPASRDTADRQSNERSLSQKHEERYIASTILDQIKATDRAALMAWGTRNPTIMPAGKVGEDGYQRGGVQFKVNGGKLGHGIVKVRLMANDTYMVETGKVRTGQWKPQGKRDGVYADSLMETIDHMIERDRPGYANRYHTALEAMVNAGTSEGVRKSWETRRGGGVQHPQEDERGMDKAFVASSKAWDGARESEQRGDFAAASAHHRAAQSAHEAAYKIERATGGTTDGTYQIEAEKHKGIADKYDKQARDIAPVAALPTASPGPSAVQVGTAEDRAAMDARVRSPQFRKMMERRRKAGARWQLTHE